MIRRTLSLVGLSLRRHPPAPDPSSHAESDPTVPHTTTSSTNRIMKHTGQQARHACADDAMHDSNSRPCCAVTMRWVVRTGRSIVPRCTDPAFALSMHTCTGARDVHDTHGLTHHLPLCIRVCRWRGNGAAAVYWARRAVACWSRRGSRWSAGRADAREAGYFHARCVLCELLLCDSALPGCQEEGGRMVGIELFAPCSADAIESQPTCCPKERDETKQTAVRGAAVSSGSLAVAPMTELMYEAKDDVLLGADCVSRITRARCHIRLGSVLLGVARGRMRFVHAAQGQFSKARHMLSELRRTGWCARLCMTASLGVLQCVQQGCPSRALLLPSLVADARTLTRGRAPAVGELLVCFLWELGAALHRDDALVDAAAVLTAGLRMLRRLPTTSRLDVQAMRRDLLEVYRVSNPERYTIYRDALMTV